MPMLKKQIFPLALCLVCILAFGCTRDNAIKLTYALGPTLAPCSGEAVVFKFVDKRPATRLGKNSDGAPISSLSDVADWVGWALFDELKAAGCDVKYRTSTVTPGDAALITGEVLDVSLNQTGTTTYAGKVTVRVMVSKGGQTVHVEKFASEVEDVVVPGYSTQSELMAEVLRTLWAEVVPTLCTKL